MSRPLVCLRTQVETVIISRRLRETTHAVFVAPSSELNKLNGELISSGSAVSINSNGYLLTTAHTVTGRLPVRQSDLRDPNVKIMARTMDGALFTYSPVFCGITLGLAMLKEPVVLDLALLKPNTSISNVPYLEISNEPAPLGTPVLMAGFSDELEFPFSIDRLIPHEIFAPPQGPSIPQSLFIHVFRQVLMIKSGMIGYTTGVTFRFDELAVELIGELMYIDNALHRGSSGGPVVNANSEIVGIITQRAITPVGSEEAPSLKIPSGSIVAISPRFILPIIHRFLDSPRAQLGK